MAYDTSALSQENILRDIHDPVTQTIRTSATAIIAPGLDVDISHTDDSVAIGTATDLFTSTTSGAKVGLDVNVIGSAGTKLIPNGETVSTYAEISSVPSNTLTTITTYIVPIGVTSYLARIEYSGDNVATYWVYINNVIADKKRTAFGGLLDTSTEFDISISVGYKLVPGDVVETKVMHDRSGLGNFSSRILAMEI